MKKLLNVAMGLVLGLIIVGCETQPVEEVPTVDVEVTGEAVEVVLPDEAVDAITDEVMIDEEVAE